MKRIELGDIIHLFNDYDCDISVVDSKHIEPTHMNRIVGTEFPKFKGKARDINCHPTTGKSPLYHREVKFICFKKEGWVVYVDMNEDLNHTSFKYELGDTVIIVSANYDYDLGVDPSHIKNSLGKIGQIIAFSYHSNDKWDQEFPENTPFYVVKMKDGAIFRYPECQLAKSNPMFYK